MEFDELVKTQNEIHINIKKLRDNIKKDGPDRKSKIEYFTNRKEKLEELYKTFKQNDQLMNPFYAENKAHEYFETTRNLANSIYKDTINSLNDTINNWKPQTEETPTKNESHLVGMQNIKGADLLRTIQAIKTNWGTELNTTSYMRQKLKNIQNKWSSIAAAHPEAAYKNQNNQEYVEQYADWEMQYDCMVAQLEDKLGNVHQDGGDLVKLTPKIKLPKMEIPIFNGNYLNWVTFRDIFTQVVHKNKELPNITKMHYLKSHVVDQAAGLLNSFNITEDNYIAAWNTLQQRYNNKRFLVSSYIKKLLNKPACQTEAAAPIRKLVDTARETLQCIANLGVDVTYNGIHYYWNCCCQN